MTADSSPYLLRATVSKIQDDSDLIGRQSQIGNRHLAFGNRKSLNRRLPMRQHSQDSIDGQVQQEIRDYRDDDRHHQRVPLIRARAGNDSSKRKVERIRHGDNKLNETGGAARCH